MQRGFTLIELIITFGIIVLLVAMTLSVFTNLRGKEDFVAAREEVANVLREARERTLASEGSQSFGVHFESESITLFKGATFDVTASSNKVYNLPPRAGIADINLAESSEEVVFDRLTGETSQSGEIALASGDNAQTGSVYIDASGSISFTASTSPSGRITDIRHLHFDLGWSIQGADTLTLDFFNDGVTENKNMSLFFNSDQSRFAWQGKINVNGNTEELIIHTHLLTATDTTLSVTRDRETNELPVRISIDGFEVVTYNGDGTATVGGSGGVMSAQ